MSDQTTIREIGRMALPAVVASNGSAIAFVLGCIGSGLEARSENRLRVAVEELCTNVARYAYPEGSKGELIIRCLDNVPDKELIFEFIDSGRPYNPLARVDPDITQAAADRPIGGLGIFLVKKCVDRVDYRFEDGHNVFIIGMKRPEGQA